jgi:hypothetical protein
MSNRVKLGVILLATLIAMVSFGLGMLVTQENTPMLRGVYTRDMYERIKPGIKRSEVEQIMGGPPVRAVLEPEPSWYVDIGGEYHYSTPASRLIDVVVWSDGLCAVEVIYCNDLVFGKTLVNLERGGSQSVLDRLRALIRRIW